MMMAKSFSLLDILLDDIFILILNKWLTNCLMDFVNFDTALCEKTLRTSYLNNRYKSLDLQKVDNNRPKLAKIIEWNRTRNFQFVALTYSIKEVFKNNFDWIIDCSALQILRLVGFECEGIIIEFNQLLINLPNLIDLVLCMPKKHINLIISDSSRNVNSCQPLFPLKSFELTCKADSVSFINIFLWLKDWCKSLEKICVQGCKGMYLEFLALVLQELPSLQTLQYVHHRNYEKVGTHLPEQYKNSFKEGNNDNSYVNTSLSEYKYVLPNLKTVKIANCSSGSNIIVAILSGTTKLREVSINDFNEASLPRFEQIMSLLSRYAENTLQSVRIDSSIAEMLFAKLQYYSFCAINHLYLAGQDNLTDSMITVICKLKLEHMECTNMEISDAAVKSFMETPECFAHLKTFVLECVDIEMDSLLQMIHKCAMLECLKLSLYLDISFNSEFLLELIKLPNVQQLTKFCIFLYSDDQSNNVKKLNHGLINTLIDQLVNAWQFPFLKHLSILDVYMNEEFFKKILDNSPYLITCEITGIVPYYQFLNSGKLIEKFKALHMSGYNSGELQHKRNNFAFLLK
jgi:hypothetical protein